MDANYKLSKSFDTIIGEDDCTKRELVVV